MKYLKLIMRCGFTLLFIVLIISPLFVLYHISQLEQQQYLPEQPVVLAERAYGEIYEATRMNFAEYVIVSGQVVSTKTIYMELKDYRNPELIRFIVEPGDVIRSGDIIGTYRGKDIVANKSGVLQDIVLSFDSYLKLASIEDIALQISCKDDKTFIVLSNKDVELKDEAGAVWKILKKETIPDENGNKRIWLKQEEGNTFTYGTNIERMKLFTGKVYNQTLVLPECCVYSYKGDQRHFVRTVDENENFIEELEVSIGMSQDGYIAVSDIEEGTLCDGGYKVIVEDTTK